MRAASSAPKRSAAAAASEPSVATKIDDWQIFQELEQLGYDHGWVPDSQMIWSDAYATLALAAWHTSSRTRES